MIERKLISAFMTSIVAFIILPALFNSEQDEFLTSAINISMYAFPIIFTYGLLASYLADVYAATKKNVFGTSIILHAILGAAIALPVFAYSFFDGEEQQIVKAELLTAGLTLGIVFFSIDLLLKSSTHLFHLKTNKKS